MQYSTRMTPPCKKGERKYPFLSGDAREALVMEFINAIPGILKNCRKNPQRNYVDYLSENVRRNL
ncbi:hypothetical protein PSCICE_12090 [Pseudomonas cichorii]|nr:hypothetical protein PSCICE_12090 [Pseudomonas cichorii]